jgi:DNA polymerase gamma 1
MFNVGKKKSLNTLININKLNSTLSCTNLSSSSHENDKRVRVNEVGVQMINEKLRSYLFGANKSTPPIELVDKSLKHLNTFDLNTKKLDSFLKDVDNIELPKLRGSNLDEHFKTIGNEQTYEYRKLISIFSANDILPKIPKMFSFKPGWTK